MLTPTARPLRVAILCHREIVARGIVAILSEHPERIFVIKPPSLTSPVSDLDVVLYDLALVRHVGEGHLTGLVRRLRGRVIAFADAAASVATSHAEALGVAGCLTLDSTGADVLAGIGRAAAGLRLPQRIEHDILSAREREIMELIFEGLSNVEIAARLCISLNTLKSHIRSAYRKMGVHSRAQAVAWRASHGGGVAAES